MPLTPPKLHDRTFEQLLFEATLKMNQSTREKWDDLTPNDPGIVLLELFTYLTEVMLYRLNRLPEHAYIAFLNLLGVSLQPPTAASANLTFSIPEALDRPVEIPRGTRVTTEGGNGGEPPIFATVEAAIIHPGQTSVTVRAFHCDMVEAEKAARDAYRETRLPNTFFRVRQPPIIAPTGDSLDLIVGVESDPDELDTQASAIEYGGKTYRIWKEVSNFTDLGPDDRYVYVADRITGTISFAPSVRMLDAEGSLAISATPLAEVPDPTRDVRVWYRRGGGVDGNLPSNVLRVVKDTDKVPPGIEVTNPEPATGGQDAETLDNALIRGPLELRSLARAVTARDYERLALKDAHASRASAFNQKDLWSFAPPGSVEVLVVPYIEAAIHHGVPVTPALLAEYTTPDALTPIQKLLDDRRPLGVRCITRWAGHKPVHIRGRLIVVHEEDPNRVRERVIRRLNQVINPLPVQEAINLAPWEQENTHPATRQIAGGWPFGRALNVSDVYHIILREPGVRWVENIRLLVDEAPAQNVASVEADYFQPNTWYAGSGSLLFRTFDNGQGWEVCSRFPEEERVALVKAHPEVPGLVVAVTKTAARVSRLHFSWDCGESWEEIKRITDFEIEDIAWTLRGGQPLLLLATDHGLYELEARGENLVQLLVDRSDPARGFYAITAFKEPRGFSGVAVSAQGLRGVYLSSQGGTSNTFRHIGLEGQDIRVLAVQQVETTAYLWAGAATPGGMTFGVGCFRWQLRGDEDSPDGWMPFNRDWNGGSCLGLTFLGTKALAATYRSGVVSLETAERDAAWAEPRIRGGLLLSARDRYARLSAVRSNPRANVVMAGGLEGVFVSTDGGSAYNHVSITEYLDKVTIPPTWTFVSGTHEFEVVDEHEAAGH